MALETGLVERIPDQTPLDHDNNESNSSCCIHLKKSFVTRAGDTQDPVLEEILDDILAREDIVVGEDTQIFDIFNEYYYRMCIEACYLRSQLIVLKPSPPKAFFHMITIAKTTRKNRFPAL